MKISGIFIFFGQSLYSRQAVKCSKIGPLGAVGCVYLTHIPQKPCSTTTMAVYGLQQPGCILWQKLVIFFYFE